MKRLLLILCGLLLLLPVCAGEIWVSLRGNDSNEGTKNAPLLTVAQALKQAREWRRLSNPLVEGGIRILLEDGVYSQTRTLFVRPEDSGTIDSPTIITAAPGARPVISGGVQVTGWRLVSERIAGLPESAQGKVWVAESPMIANRLLDFRQLWVNGAKAVCAAQFAPGEMERMIDFVPSEQIIRIPTPNVSGLETAKQLEMVIHQRWATAILRVKNLNVKGNVTDVTFHEPESQLEFAHPWPQPVIGEEKGNSSFYLCNALQLLDQPGEWYREYPSGNVYYWPREGEDMRVATAIVPALEELVRVDGTLERPVAHIHFEGIGFEHAAWLRPSYQGHVTLQGGFHLLDAYKLLIPGLPEKAELENQAWIARPEAAIRIKGASHINFTGCDFKRLAATALDYEWAATQSTVAGCYFTDIGGTAILLGTFPDGGFETHVPYKPLNMDELCSDIRIANNLITEVTNEDWGCVGIAAGYVANTTIEHNEVSHVNYSGICVGWGWTKLDSGMRNNHIRNNYVHHFAKQLYDAGGLYTLSSQPESSMTGNRIEALIDAPYATNERAFYIYFDEATSYYIVENNWCPEARFGTNTPGPGNVWNNNGPMVDVAIKQAAGIQKEWKEKLQNR
ncbi:right-handed parallel beta-helix repeat-containing protein [Bacteroides sp. 214]|uniref:right-handed parallel beta-helix repeat-containing protein n=1 Tax=Bacteroides sp. 214 TaxID=2302935 RepID=UPI0013CFB65E|nr:right-handed parallel beta-helix repeat-containing protein [Bacteroides sp. 214]NDW12233.1 right-handed parallel beta-helix repeat-containing protein [Bacteroides sp. 214]